MSEDEESALTDAEWDLVDSAQQKLDAGDEDLTAEEAAAVQKAIDAGELEVEEEAEG
jgi:anti-sigma28 factor (negative regulator of flagellin synthesis)